MTTNETREVAASTRSTETAQTRGLESRYRVEKIHDPTRKHDGCRYFVLDPQHDGIALAALARYAQVARAEGYAALADDLDRWVGDLINPPGQTPPGGGE